MISEIRARFTYSDGVLLWAVRPRNGGASVGGVAGSLASNGRWIVNVGKKKVLRSRAVWMMHNGVIPDGMEIDHINHNTLDDRIENLRLVNRITNARNLSKRRDNTSGVTGVTYCKRDNLWQAKIYNNGRCINLGHFRCMDDAVSARERALIDMGYHENHGK